MAFPLDTLLNVAIEHRLMHVETLAYMLHQLPLDRKVPQARSSNLVTPPVDSSDGSDSRPGQRHWVSRAEARTFGWDNEYETHTVQVPAFEIDSTW